MAGNIDSRLRRLEASRPTEGAELRDLNDVELTLALYSVSRAIGADPFAQPLV